MTYEQMRDALRAVTGVDHDIRGFDLHFYQRPTPMELLEDEEENELQRDRIAWLHENGYQLSEAA